MMSQYLQHITINTGDTRRSWRHEIDPTLMPDLIELVRTAREETGALLPHSDPQCWLTIEDTRRCALMSVRATDDTALATIVVATHQRCGSQLWTVLHEAPDPPMFPGRRPELPWCAVRLHAGIEVYPQAAAWLGDLERCLAWAWLAEREHADAG